MARVFVCYDREDRDFAEVVQAKLERAGHTTAMDLDILNAGEDWQDKLDLAIRGSQALVVIMTPEARASDYVAYEWAFALGAGVKVIPLEMGATSFPPRLDGLHRLEFSGKARPWDTLLAEVQKAEASNPSSTIQVEAGMPPAVRQAVRGIDSLDADERLAAVKTLAQTDHQAAREALAKALQHPVRDVRVAAACLFPDRTDARVIPGLVDVVDAYGEWEKWFPRWRSFVVVVEEIGAPAVPELVRALRERTGAQTRGEILEALGRIGDASSVPAILEALKDRDSDVRRAAAKALGRLAEPSAGPELAAILNDDDVEVRAAAATSLGLLKIAPAVPDLLKLLEEDAPAVRRAAARALGRIGNRSAVVALVGALRDEDYQVIQAAIEALGELGDTDAIAHLRPLLTGDGTDIAERDNSLFTALVRLKDSDSLPSIEKRLVNFRSGTGSGDVHKALGQFGDEGVRVLIRVLETAHSDTMQREAAKALEPIRTPEALAALKAWKRKHG